MSALTILSHPICYMALVFLFTMGAFEYGVATLNNVRSNWRRIAFIFCLSNAVVFYLVEYYFLGKLPPSIAILIAAITLAPEVYVVARDSLYCFFYLVISVIFVMLMSYNLAILIVRSLNIVGPGGLDITATMTIGSIMYILASLYLFFDTRMPFIKLENFNRLMHNQRGRYLLFYFLLFDIIMVFSILFIRMLLFFDTVTGRTLSNLLFLLLLLNILILVSSFLIVLFLCRIDSRTHQMNVISETASKDNLTGILNRTGFVTKLEQSLSKGNSGTFFLLDLDNFKAVNDTLGHQAGDRVLIDCAQIMQNIFRTTDYIGRLGGDEFMAFAENLTDTEMVENRASTLCDNLSLTIEEEGKSVQIGCSIGIVTNVQNNTFTNIYNNADKALYSAKTDGKGRYKLASIE